MNSSTTTMTTSYDDNNNNNHHNHHNHDASFSRYSIGIRDKACHVGFRFMLARLSKDMLTRVGLWLNAFQCRLFNHSHWSYPIPSKLWRRVENNNHSHWFVKYFHMDSACACADCCRCLKHVSERMNIDACYLLEYQLSRKGLWCIQLFWLEDFRLVKNVEYVLGCYVLTCSLDVSGRHKDTVRWIARQTNGYVTGKACIVNKSYACTSDCCIKSFRLKFDPFNVRSIAIHIVRKQSEFSKICEIQNQSKSQLVYSLCTGQISGYEVDSCMMSVRNRSVQQIQCVCLYLRLTRVVRSTY